MAREIEPNLQHSERLFGVGCVDGGSVAAAYLTGASVSMVAVGAVVAGS